jgi:hypothetical protein
MRHEASGQHIPILVEIELERVRQRRKEKWTLRHDDAHHAGELAAAAAAYALHDTESTDIPACWPWREDDWKPKDRRRNLVRAAALIVAEIERIERAADHPQETT